MAIVDATHAHCIVIAEVKRLQQTETGVQHDGNRCHMRMRPQRVGKDSAQHKHNYSLPPASGLVRKLKSAVLFVCGLPGPPLPPWPWASKALMAVL